MLSFLLEWDVYFTNKCGICAMSNSRWGFLRPLMKYLEYSCHGVPWFIVVISAICLHSYLNEDELELSVNLFLALCVDILVVGSIKLLFQRKRPLHNVDDMKLSLSVDAHSFPSGHSTRAVLLAFFLIYNVSFSSFMSSCIKLWALLVCISRILLGRHHILDVIVGAAIGYIQYILIEPFWLDIDYIQYY